MNSLPNYISLVASVYLLIFGVVKTRSKKLSKRDSILIIASSASVILLDIVDLLTSLL
jgi:hypothetical protein